MTPGMEEGNDAVDPRIGNQLSNPQYHVVMIHPFDPRGAKVGGIETYVRDYIAYHPEDMNLLFVGVDGFGDLTLGVTYKICFRGRQFNFLPVLRHEEHLTGTYAGRLTDSLTLRFFCALFAYRSHLRSHVKNNHATVELRRVEFAWFAWTLRRPFIQMLHDGAQSNSSSMSSLLKKYWILKRAGDFIGLVTCTKFYCVSEELSDRLRKLHPRFASKISTLPTWADPARFGPTEFEVSDDILRVAYAGRLDRFKSPGTMFRVIERINELRGGAFEFHYIGDGEPAVFPEFAAIRGLTVMHGKQSADGVAAIIRKMHVGLLTSEYEGMPRFVMEMLASGRPVCALHLPQLEKIVISGVSGELVERSSIEIEELATRVLSVWQSVKAKEINPNGVSATVASFRPENLLGRVFADHVSLRAR